MNSNLTMSSIIIPPLPHVTRQVLPVDYVMGRLDRLLSEFLHLTEAWNLDEVDAQTIKHHADDLIGVGQKAISNLRKRGVEIK